MVQFYSVGIGLALMIAILFVPALENLAGALLALLFPVLYLVYIIVDTKIYAENTYIELKDNSVVMSSKNLKSSTNLSIPLAEIESITTNQNLVLKIFGMCQINILQQSGLTHSTWGYDSQLATEFVKQVGEAHRVHVRI